MSCASDGSTPAQSGPDLFDLATWLDLLFQYLIRKLRVWVVGGVAGNTYEEDSSKASEEGSVGPFKGCQRLVCPVSTTPLSIADAQHFIWPTSSPTFPLFISVVPWGFAQFWSGNLDRTTGVHRDLPETDTLGSRAPLRAIGAPFIRCKLIFLFGSSRADLTEPPGREKKVHANLFA